MIRQSPDKIFAFFSDEKNLEQITPPWLNFRVLGKSTPQLSEGTLIDYELKLRGIPLRWQSRIEEWREGSHFVDTQVKGPYALWHHTHRFEPVEGGILMVDEVRYRLPGGPVGDRLGGWFVRRDLEQIFAYRRQQIEAHFGK